MPLNRQQGGVSNPLQGDLDGNNNDISNVKQFDAEQATLTTQSPMLMWGYSRASLPTALNGPGSGVIGDELYIAGGDDGTNQLDTLFAFYAALGGGYQ